MSDKKKTLARNTNVDGVTYLAGSTPPDDVAERITNPKCWEAPDGIASIMDGVGASVVDGGEPDSEPTVNAGLNASGSAATEAGSGTGDPDPESGDEGSDVAPEELKGKALDEALEAAGLSKAGTVAEKRARLEQAQSGS